MKSLNFVVLALLLMSFFGCNRNKAARQYERFLEDSARIEFVTPPEDSVKLEGDDAFMNNDDALLEIPDIPQERPVNMRANDYELDKEISGKGN